MSVPDFLTTFQKATGKPQPYDYQRRLACGEKGTRSEEEWNRTGAACESRLINIPTGLGKTAAVVLAWMWNRVLRKDPAWPRRLVYCLPMRTLVEQTRDEVEKWLKTHGLLWDGKAEPHAGKVGLHILMGGEDSGEWDIYPEENAILIGTQDMLLSRALNRGYGMSPYRWPMHFGLLNNDALWVMDETQLMGPALWTSAQLDWMRHDRFRSLVAAPTWWMSATVGDEFLKTSDRTRNQIAMPPVLELGSEPQAAKKLAARRPCEMWIEPTQPKKKASAKAKTDTNASGLGFAGALGAAVLSEHLSGTLSLVICNTVATAQAVFAAVQKGITDGIPCALLTSRFRKADRKGYVDQLLAFEAKRKSGTIESTQGLICVSTQAVEAGVDVSATQLWSEVAPWPSLVQRMGRLNRDGGSNKNAQARFFTAPSPEGKAKKGQRVGPYAGDAVARGEKILTALIALLASEQDLSARDALAMLRQQSAIGKEINAALQPDPDPYPRASDIHGLFSTEPDVFGGFTDVSPFVRDSDDDSDVTVFWRKDVPKQMFPPRELDGPAYAPAEGVRVSIGSLRKLLEPKGRACLWDDKKGEWASLGHRELCPGMVLMLRASDGGYDVRRGWTGESRDRLADLESPGPFTEDFADDKKTITGDWQDLASHLREVKAAAENISSRLGLPENLAHALTVAAAYHDIGKSLPKWQEALPKPSPNANEAWAKSLFLLAVAPSSKEFRPEWVEALLAEAKIEASKAAPFLKGPDDQNHYWQICSLVLNKKERQWKAELSKLPGVGKAWHVPFRPGLRHEAGSALALWWRYFREDADFPGLAIYLAAAHHGKVRTVLTSRGKDGTDVCGIAPTTGPLNWENGMPMDFACAGDGTSGTFSEDGTTFTSESPGWTALVVDLLGAAGEDAQKLGNETHLCLSSRASEASHLGPFALAYLEALIVASDIRPATESNSECSILTQSE